MIETKEYRTMDAEKAAWGSGAWLQEPDKKQWEDAATGLPCLIVRNHMGALCGYVGVYPEHPWHGVEYSDDEINPEMVISVHGGLTFSDSCRPSEEGEEHGICHITDDPREVWWFGFDCAHAFDLVPKMAHLNEVENYRDFDYVTEEVEQLAIQLKAIGEK